MILSDLTYLEEVVEAPSIVGGQSRSSNIFEYCEPYSYYDQHGNESYYYECTGKLRRRPKSYSFSGSSPETESVAVV
jgi:hypothetical protein